jgi:hypothetical protein
MVGRFWSLFRSTNQHHQIQLAAGRQPCIRLPKKPIHLKFILKMETAMPAETLGNFQHS